LGYFKMIYNLDIRDWAEIFSDQQKESTLKAIENGEVIYLPKLNFELSDQEKDFLTPASLSPKSKNISFNPINKELKGSSTYEPRISELKKLMERFSLYSRNLILALFPQYQSALMMGRTSFRPAEIKGRASSIRKDDTRLHVDAFPATPNQGKRILRVFSNINPFDQDRVWLLGEPFEAVVKKFKPKFRKPFPGSRALLHTLKITKSYRSLYDHYMLILHDAMKLDDHYQQTVSKIEFRFPPGSSWIVMTDKVSHAALSGQHLLEQTFYLPIEAMQNPLLSPLRLLDSAIHSKKPFIFKTHSR
jgi:hypothetical protein